MRRTASGKLELIRLVENSDLSARETLRHLAIPRSTFYGWYERFLTGGQEALEDRKPKMRRYWNRIPTTVKGPRFSRRRSCPVH